MAPRSSARRIGGALAFLGVLGIVVPGRAAGAAPDAAAAPELPFEAEIRAFEAHDRGAPPHIPAVVFVGSSSIRLWDSMDKDFPRHHVLNRGFGGSHIADSVRYADRVVIPYRPPLVVLFAGTNDIDAGKTPEMVLADFQAFAARVWARLPHTEIAFISITTSPSRFAQVERVRRANQLIADACAADPRLHFIDVFPRMLGEDGHPRPELYIADGLHMNRRGYEIWIPLIRPVVEAVGKSTRRPRQR